MVNSKEKGIILFFKSNCVTMLMTGIVPEDPTNESPIGSKE